MYTIHITPVSAESHADEDCRFLQSPFWAQFKSAHGWKAERYSVTAVKDSHSSVCTMSVLVRTFSKACFHFSIAYIPMAPELSFCTNEKPDTDSAVEKLGEYASLLAELSRALKTFLPAQTLCVRFDIPLDFYTCEDRDFYVTALTDFSKDAKLGLKKTRTDIQPPDTVLLDLQPSPDDMLARMKPKWRYNIKLAEKKGVQVTAYHAGDAGFDAALDVFYGLYETTAKRDGIAIHTKEYYRNLLESSKAGHAENADVPLVTLYIASHENDSLAAIITLFCKREAVYLYGASGNVKRNLMPAYLLQWTAVNDAKVYGSPVYDFYGMPPTDDEHHPMHGLYLFKTGFGGTIVHRPGSVDIPTDGLYRLYTAAENMRAFWHKKVLKVIRGR